MELRQVKDKVRDSTRKVADAKRGISDALMLFKSLGSGFTANVIFSREYSKLDAAVKEAERALDKVTAAINDIERKTRV